MRLTLGQAAEVRLGRQRSPEHEVGEHPARYLRSANVVDGRLDLSDVKTMNFSPAERVIFALEDGDVLVTEGSGSIDTVGTSAVWRQDLRGVICFQNTLLRLRPRTGITTGPYLAWWARHARLSGQIAAISSGANIKHLGSDGLKRLALEVPSLADQRRIADFLNDRVARIDQIIASRRRQVALEAAGFHSELEFVLGQRGARQPLKHLLASVTSGPRGWGDLVSDEGTPFVRITNLSALGIELKTQQLISVTAPDDAEAARARLNVGDVLLSITAVFGEVAVWRNGTGTFSQHVARIRPLRVEDADWIAWCLQSRSVHDQYRLSAYGGTKVGLGLGEVRNITVPMATSAARESTARTLSARWSSFSAMSAGLEKSVELLVEYKQALISAAVTGELDATTAGSGIPG